MFDTGNLRSDLLEDLKALRGGQIPRSEARARAVLARAVLDTVKVEIAAASLNMTSFEPLQLERPARTLKRVA